MRIAVVSSSYPAWEGDPSGHFVRAEVRALEAEGHHVTVFAARGGAFGWPGVLPKLREKPWRALASCAALVTMRRLLGDAGPFDRVVAHFLPMGWVPRFEDGPLDLVGHGSDVRLFAKMPRPPRERLLAHLFERAREVRVVAKPLADELLASVDARARATLESKLRIEAAAIDLGDLTRIRRRGEELRATHRVGTRLGVTVGRLIEGKCVDRVLDRAARDDIELVVVGDGPERGALEARARRLGGHVRFVGDVEHGEALAWIAAADVVFHASRTEGLSTVLREAAELATPAIRW